MIIPDAVINAASAAEPGVNRHQVRRMLEAAWPLIAAEERARIRALLPYNVNCCDGFEAAVADMIGEHGDTPC